MIWFMLSCSEFLLINSLVVFGIERKHSSLQRMITKAWYSLYLLQKNRVQKLLKY